MAYLRASRAASTMRSLVTLNGAQGANPMRSMLYLLPHYQCDPKLSLHARKKFNPSHSWQTCQGPNIPPECAANPPGRPYSCLTRADTQAVSQL